MLALGSVARHESLLGPDQDNAMIIADYPDARHTEIDGYFQALGERFTARLQGLLLEEDERLLLRHDLQQIQALIKRVRG